MEGAAWQQSGGRRRKSAGIGLEAWTKSIGLPEKVQEAIRNRALRAEDLQKVVLRFCRRFNREL